MALSDSAWTNVVPHDLPEIGWSAVLQRNALTYVVNVSKNSQIGHNIRYITCRICNGVNSGAHPIFSQWEARAEIFINIDQGLVS